MLKVRFAPSPTGPLHIGGARSALFNYLLARKEDGVFIVRSEDTDLERSSRESEHNIMEALRWLNIQWDEGIEVGGDNGPYRQTERLALYQEYTDRLLASGDAYYCYCSEEELEQERQDLMAKGETPRYLGKCRHLSAAERQTYEAAGRKPVVRFRVPEGRQILINDRVRGEVVFDSDGIGDYVIVKSDGIPTYNFAVVIDDTTMNITHVIRGEEHLSNTPRQVLIYQALGLPTPEFAHISLILNTEGKKMSKRDGDTAVIDYQAKGYLPEAVVNFIALMGWSPPGEEEFFTLEEMTQAFSLERVSKSPAVFDLNKLNYMNAHYIKQADPERLTDLAVPYLREMGAIPQGTLSEEERAWVTHYVQAIINHLSYMAQVKDFVHYVQGGEAPTPEGEALEILQGEQVPAVLDLFVEKLKSLEAIRVDTVKPLFKQITKETKLGGKQVFMPIRIALTGQMHGPELYDIVPLLGLENVLSRLAGTKALLAGSR
ncbi:glutamate--tRNA ligase [Desulfitobacterium hafniense]|uniref:Glutamate--tRNA ligase n=5 Tax=root TaxID=1 RepID=SYE_DESHY|nr:glutamate--tRNA ligase [Desulfitobacterium hafniense]Q250Q8.1 RecName: Full=Glutamate--tRNA ligase; AltName: Full=Glutamyl-tRNA synthetase; Short=GluRS [Desulfitobacterium hafniense Y51]ACL18463.1 glutamyl-tRNA synthetase [Desulfitobacterium hafniense DCB-2]EHL07921.1 glutamate--tRNA ligase [Desulfitobacterium hafniense DP7]KTE92872.1 glutamate--tRNA ligase [Desulfitobacterium hafniense]MEA5023741.1 glutamate--tRNA ligase [Desulfitobacterium hafniense]CDX00439.1 Glutamate--tRNA ligase [Des